MRRGIYQITILMFLLLILGAASCVTVNQPPQDPPSTTEQTSTPDSKPEYHTLTVELEGKGKYAFPIYLHDDETLHFTFMASNYEDRIYLWILTPSGKTLGSYTDPKYKEYILNEHSCRSFAEFTIIFSPVDYDGGEGYYRMELENESTISAEVTVDYWIEK